MTLASSLISVLPNDTSPLATPGPCDFIDDDDDKDDDVDEAGGAAATTGFCVLAGLGFSMTWQYKTEWESELFLLTFETLNGVGNDDFIDEDVDEDDDAATASFCALLGFSMT